MTINQCIEQLLEIEEKRGEKGQQATGDERENLARTPGLSWRPELAIAATALSHVCIARCLSPSFSVYSGSTLAFGVARLGQSDQQIVSGTLDELLKVDFGGPLHSLVLAAPEIHELEEAMFEYHHWDKVARSAERRRLKAEREARDAAEEVERKARLAAQWAANPTVQRSTVPKVKAPVKASATAPTLKPDESDSDDEVVMEPLF